MHGLYRFLQKIIGKVWLAAVYLFLYFPLFFLILFSFNSTRQDAVFTGFSTRWYTALLNDSRLVEGFFLSLRVAVIAGTLSTILGSFAAFVLVRYARFRGRSLFSGLVTAPLVMPEVITGLSLLLLMVAVQQAIGWPQRGAITIVIGHTLLGMAYATVVIAARLREMDRAIEEAAMDLGCRPLQVFFLVTLPNILPSLIAAWMLTFTLSFDDVVVSEFLSGPGVTTLPQVIFGYARRGVNPSIYAAATILILTVSTGIIAYSLYTVRTQARREREIKAAERGELAVDA
ncbi:MAG: ABC transporter permease subunit [Propionivibrio sp.]